MKKILFLCLSVFLFMSCDDFLDTENLTKKDTSNFPKTEADIDMMIAATYGQIANVAALNNPFFMSELLSDDRFGAAGQGDVGNRALGHLRRQGEDHYSGTWSDMYAAIYRTNSILKNLDMVTWENQADRDAIEGETLFLRAYAYMNLCRTFGTVPLVLTTEPVNLPRATPEELWGQIAADLKAAIAKMPAVNFQSMDKSRLGHATKWAAESIMARAWLFYTGYYKKESMPLAGGGSVAKSEVVDWLKDVVNNSGHGLLPNFWSLWPYSNDETAKDYKYMQNIKAQYGDDITWIKEEGANIENIFCYKYTSLGDSYGESSANQMILYSSIRGWGFGNYGPRFFPLGQGWGGGTVNAQLWDEWLANEPDDLRRQASIFDVTDKDEIADYEWNGDHQMEETGYWNKKYIAINVVAGGQYINYGQFLFGASSDYRRNNIQDTYIVRFADVLLMLAELTEDVSYINKVRARVGLPELTSYTTDALRQERRYELCFEGVRYYDLLRWHIAGDQLVKKNGSKIMNDGKWTVADYADMKDRIEETGGFLAIPASQIRLSEGVLVQDDAWAGPDAIYSGY